jgi:hypothetical protein
MLMSFRNLVLSSAALCATAAFAAEQKRVEVPFDFVAKNHAYQAGTYAISIDNNRSSVTLSEIGKSSQPLTWVVMPGNGDPSHPQVGLTFDRTQAGNVLKAIRYQTLTTPDLNKKPKQAVESITSVGE